MWSETDGAGGYVFRYRATVKKEFDGLKALFGEYIAALKKTYTVPVVTDQT